MRSITKGELGFARQGWCLLAAAVFVAGCGAAPEDAAGSPEANLDREDEAVVAAPEDGLADAFNSFLDVFTGDNFSDVFPLGYAFHPGLSTETVKGPTGA